MGRLPYFAAALALGAACSTSAAAQGATGFPMGDVGQVLRQAEQPLTSWAPPPGPLKRLSKASRDWIAEETRRQVETPREPVQVLVSIEAALEKDVLRRARRERIAPIDFYSAILFQIMLGAETEVARKVGHDADHPGLAQAQANRRQAGELQSQDSLYMAAM